MLDVPLLNLLLGTKGDLKSIDSVTALFFAMLAIPGELGSYPSWSKVVSYFFNIAYLIFSYASAALLFSSLLAPDFLLNSSYNFFLASAAAWAAVPVIFLENS